VIVKDKWKGRKRLTGVLAIPDQTMIEIFYEDPKQTASLTLVIICHPNPLAQGSMHHKIPTLLARSAHLCDLPSLRFQFSGVGLTSAPYIDFLQQVSLLDQIIIQAQCEGFEHIILAGFSFGAACILQHTHICPKLAIAPAWKFFAPSRPPLNDLLIPHYQLTIIHAQDDSIVLASESVAHFAALRGYNTTLTLFGTGEHFFQTQLESLKAHCLLFFHAAQR